MAVPVCACAETATSATPSRTVMPGARMLPPAPGPERDDAALGVVYLQADGHVAAARIDLDGHDLVRIEQLVDENGAAPRRILLHAVDDDRHRTVWATRIRVERHVA